SGLGVMGRKADLKYRVTDADVDSLAELQFKILKNAASYVKVGGTLVFSTCTVSRRENEENVRRVLEDHDSFGLKAADIKDRLPAALAGMCEGNHVQLLTGEPADMPLMDGFFISVFTKE
ncbi:MAG: 16S rRNA (cytosine(967)-C(5))-methyltransferase, partial [Lachnospiraceae bacterium]|nr:16S rRNA (cytosine(967)-C(5))-methyltransferase [Lachnospiraceae bacterium]